MQKTEAQSVGDIIEHFLKAEHLDAPLDAQRASAIWPQVVGQGINRYTISRSVEGGVMTVRLSSAVLRGELMMARSTLVNRINEALGKKVITDIVFK